MTVGEMLQQLHTDIKLQLPGIDGEIMDKAMYTGTLLCIAKELNRIADVLETIERRDRHVHKHNY